MADDKDWGSSDAVVGADWGADDVVVDAPDEALEPEAAEPERGFLSSLGSEVWQGTKSAGRSVLATGNTAVGDLPDVESLAKSQNADRSNDAKEKKALLAEIERRKKLNPEAGWTDAVKDVAGAALDNKTGTAQMVASQLPNSAVALGGAWAGGKAGAAAGAALGSLVGPVGTVVGGLLGGLSGMFLGNWALEAGGKALEKAGDGYTQQESSEALTEGAKKAAVITGVDYATLGLGKLGARAFTGPAVQAGARAEAKVLAEAGVDITDGIKIAQALTNPELRSAAKAAGEAAAKAASTATRRAGNAATGMVMETGGEGLGEYYGEEFATGEGNWHDAALEAVASASQSSVQTAMAMRDAGSNNLDPKGMLRAQLADQQSKGNSPLSNAALQGRPDLQLPADELAPDGAIAPDASLSSEFFDAGAPDGLPGTAARPIEPGAVNESTDAAAGLGAGPGVDPGAAPDAPRPLIDDLGDAAGDPNAAAADALRGEPGSPLVVGEPLDDEWTAFHPESGTLNVPREQMPQIKSEHRSAMVNFLKARGVDTETDTVAAEDLKPTQDKFAPAKVKQAAEFEGSDRPVLVSSDGHVLDGHHQWLAKAAQEAPVKVIRLNAPIAQLLTLMEQFPSAGMTKSTPAASAQSAPTGVTSLQPTETADVVTSDQAQQEKSPAPQAPAAPVARTQVAAPQTILAQPASPTNTGTVQVRQRRAQLAHMAGRGFIGMEERDGVTYLVNQKQNAEMPLGSSVDVALARQAVVAAGGTGDTVRQTTGVQNDNGRSSEGVQPNLGREGENPQNNSAKWDSLSPAGLSPNGLRRGDAGSNASGDAGAGPTNRLTFEQERALIEDANQASGGRSLAVPATDPRRAALEPLLDVWEKLTGQRPIVVDDTNSDGYAYKGRSFLSINNPHLPAGWTAGHEFVHLTKNHPVLKLLYARIWREINQEDGKRRYYAYLERTTPSMSGSTYDTANTEQLKLLEEEMVADYMGKRLTDKPWLTEIARKQPHLFGQFIKEWIPLLNGVLQALRGIAAHIRGVKDVDAAISNHQKAKDIAEEVLAIWAKERPGYAGMAREVIQDSRRAGAEQWRQIDNFLVPEITDAFTSNTGNLVTLAPFKVTNLDGRVLHYKAMPVRISVGKHGDGGEQFGVQHRLDNAIKDRTQRSLTTPFLGQDNKAVVERATRDIAHAVLSATHVFADKRSASHVVLWNPQTTQSVVLQQTVDKGGSPYWSVKTVIPKDQRKMTSSYGEPVPVKGSIIDGVEQQQSNAITARILKALREPAFGLSSPESYTLSDLGLIVNQAANNGDTKTTAPKAKTPEEIAEARARMRAKLLKNKPEAIQLSARVALQDDAQAQEQWLQNEAQQQGYADIEELLTQNYPMFVALAKQWREQHPAEVLYSGRDDMDLDFMAELQAELDAEMNGELGVSDAAIAERGLWAEDAFPDLAFEKKSGNYQTKIPDLYREGAMGVIQLDSEQDGLWGSQFVGTWIGPANTEKTGNATLKMAKAFAKRFVVSKELRERKFDLASTVTPAQKNAVVQAWKGYNALDDVRRYPMVNDALPVKALAQKMGLTRTYDINVTNEVMDANARTLLVEFVNKANGDVQAAVLELNKVDGKWLGTANTSSLSRGGLGAAFYQMMVEYAGARGIVIHPDHSLSGVNTYRRTEQMLAAALRTGKSNVMVPHPTQRVYGFQNNASTPEEHDANLARLLLAGLRNVQELAPKADKLVYHPETGAFTDKKGKDQEAAVRKMLEDTDARAFGLGRATLARAVLTRMAMSGEPVPATSFKEPVLYSARDTAELEYQAVVDQYQGTDMWLRAPNGAATNLTERQWVQVRTPSFLRWFGDWTQGNVWGRDDVSKVVDENNEPLVVYHGTDKGGFYKFQQPGGERRGDLGIFTTSNRDMAASYVRKGREQDMTPKPMATREDLEEAGVSFDAIEVEVSRAGQDDVTELQHYWYDGYEHGPFDSEEQAVTDALENFEPETQTKSGIYATFLNLRNPGEEDFEGALWNGDRSHLWQVVVGDEPQESDGKIYFSEEEARELAKTFAAPDDEFEGADFMRAADDHWLTTDDAVRQARRMGNDGAIIRQVVDDGGGYSRYDNTPSDVYVAFEPNQIKSADFNTGEFGRSDDIRHSTRSLAEVAGYDASFILANGKKWRTGKDLKVALQSRVKRYAREFGIHLYEDHDYLVEVGVQDALFALSQNPNAVGWYDEKTKKALAIVALIHPELATDEDARFAYIWVLATTSNGQKVAKNFEYAERVYSEYKRTGRMPTDWEYGQAQKSINKSLALFNTLKDRWKIDNLRKFMQTNFTVGEIGALDGDITPQGEHVDVMVKGAAIIGPKIGNGFFSNLYGFFDALTMDRWLVRTWGRWTGTLIGNNAMLTFAAQRRMTAAIIDVAIDPEARLAISKLIGKQLSFSSDPNDIAKLIAMALMVPENRAMMNALEAGSELRLAGNSLAKYLDGQKEAPQGSVERKKIRSVFEGILQVLRQNEAYKDLTMADLQAVLWYSEKRLYENAKDELEVNEDGENAGYEDDEAPDYANAAAKLARDKGIGEKRIARILNGDPKRFDGAGAFDDKQRQAFIKMALLEKDAREPKLAKVVFEVAPHPGTMAAKAWNQLSPSYQKAISDRIIEAVVVKILQKHNLEDSLLIPQIGSYENDTNQSYAIALAGSKKALEVMNEIGYVLGQKEMMAISPKKITGMEPTGVAVIDIGSKTPKQIDTIYQKLRKLKVKGQRIVGGQSTMNGQMLVLNFTDMSIEDYSLLIDKHLGGKYNIHTHAVFSAFPSFEDYNYASKKSYSRGNGKAVRQWLDSLRNEATDILRTELSLGDTEVRFSTRDTAGDRPSSRGRPLDAATIRSAVHFGKQPGLSILSGRSNGTGIRGAEDQRVKDATDPRIKQRVYFYSPVDGGIPQPETGLGGAVYQADIEGLYDPRTATRPVNGAGNAFESAVLDAGYNGYVGPESGVIVVLGQDVPVKHIGAISDFKIVQRVATRFIPKNVTRTEGDELVRKPEGQEMAQLANPKKQTKIRDAAPSFRMEYGYLRVKAVEADAADQAIAEFSPTFRFNEVQFSAKSNTPEVLPNGSQYDEQSANTKIKRKDWSNVKVKVPGSDPTKSLSMPIAPTLDNFDERTASMKRLLACL